jgi:hypothetical protein
MYGDTGVGSVREGAPEVGGEGVGLIYRGRGEGESSGTV